MKRRGKFVIGSASALVLIFMGFIGTAFNARSKAEPAALSFEVSFPASIHVQAITGHVLVAINEKERPEPRMRVGWWTNSVPLFGVDVNELKPGEPAIIDAQMSGKCAMIKIPSNLFISDGHLHGANFYAKS
jgi:hypothetical protein